MFAAEDREKLLRSDEDAYRGREDVENGEQGSMITSRRQNNTSRWLVAFLVISMMMNAFFIFDYSKSRIYNVSPESKLLPLDYISTRKSPYSGISHDTQIPYTHHNEYTSSNMTLANEMWDQVDNVLAIAVSKQWAEEKGLPPSWTFPWDLDKKIYFPKVGHQLHCLKSIRTAFHQLWESGETQLARGHLEHCLDSLRQDVQCQADDTPMPALKPIDGVGDYQMMQCKNWDKFHDWLYAPERHACYKHVNAYKGVKHPIERFAFCPEDSETFPIMKEYFDLHGHIESLEDLG